MSPHRVQLRPTDTLDIAPADGGRLGLRGGELVRLTSRYGAAALPVRLDAAISIGQAFATFQDPSVRLNRITGPHRDGLVDTPEYKVTAVRIERAAGEP